MTQRVGGVEFDVIVDDSGVTSATSRIVENNEEVERSFNQIDRTTRRASRNITRNTGQAAQGLGQFSRQAGQAGIQIQQLVGQIQGGQSVFGALSAQAADLGIVLGAPLVGAVAGLSAAFAGALLPSLFDSKSSMELLEAASEQLKKSLQSTEEGTLALSDGIREIAERSEALARVRIASSIVDAEKQIEEATKGISQSIFDIANISLKSFNDTIINSGLTLDDLAEKSYSTAEAAAQIGIGGVRRITDLESNVSTLARRFDITREQAVRLGSAISEFQNNQGPVGVARLQSTLESLAGETENSNEKILELTNTIIPFIMASADGVDAVNFFRQAIVDLNGTLAEDTVDTKAITETANNLTSVAQSIALIETELSGGTEEAQRMAAAFQFGASSFEALPESAQALINRLIEVREQQRENSEELINQRRAEMQAERESEVRSQKIEQIKKSFLTEQQLAAENFLIEGEMLRTALENQEITKAEFDEIERQRVLEHQNWILNEEARNAQERARIQEQYERTVQSFRNAAVNNAVALLDQFAGESRVAAIAAIAINKGLALAQNKQNTLVAQTRALAELGPIAGPPAAAKIGAYGAVNAALIAATGFAQALSTGGGNQAFSGGVPATVTTQNQAAQGQIQPDRNISISLTGGNFTGGDIRSLIEAIDGELGDGVSLGVTG